MTEFSSALVEIRKLAPETAPQPSVPAALHVAIIMDGNGRWARARGLPRTMGHYHGAEAARAVVKAAVQSGVTHLTLFGFSSENWKRPKAEVQYLMGMLRRYLQRDVKELHEAGIRLSVIGERAALPGDIVTLIGEAEKLTRDNCRLHLTIALNYGGRGDIVTAVRRLASRVATGMLDPEDIDEGSFGAHLSTASLPDPDLMIRTSGEQRISNFLLWQLAYAEMAFVEKCWPDFTGEDLMATLAEFRRRDRRFGAIMSDAQAGAAI
ncbi:isoprenyl transferase [Dongia deserti]|uniref:isoprenyl transferase n=1 Tax=Dongia deserti TaxID=2268030 RepID=UPI000E64F41B|nr:isoprenyl transferase [Dongia deserti]